ncbi:hypothetical protein MM326_12595 [Alkalihalobacillus sp. LMS6]|uniref:hypothetical protein n=1 Tax=Bacillaceae TaxID=186817 RepID=UPI000C06A1C7|nr:MULTISPECIES: hypothetical protein [Bacillaceae]UTR04963.1 hypothetical protein MM326_12595 [Alkalihalobacillus sp. LMS6]
MKTKMIVGQSHQAEGLASYVEQKFASVERHRLDTLSAAEVDDWKTESTHILFIIPAKKIPYLQLKRLLSNMPKQHKTTAVTLMTTDGTTAHHAIIQMSLRGHFPCYTHIQLPEYSVQLKVNGQLIENDKFLKRLRPLEQMFQSYTFTKTVS